MSSRIMWTTKEQIFTEADRIKELESENTILREALEKIAQRDLCDDDEVHLYHASIRRAREALQRAGDTQ